MKGAEILIDVLKREGVNVIFGYPGGTVIPVFDALYKTEKIKFILTRHEQAATHAADGYARATGKVGVCIVTSGPGATNTITGIATAKLDSIPIIIISGQVKTEAIGTDAFQEVDMVGLTRSICKHNYLIQRIKELPETIKEAFYIAKSGRPGPVLIDLPVDVSNDYLQNYNYPQKINLPGYKPNIKVNKHQIDRLVKEIKIAKRPLLYTGGGIISSGASNELLGFIKKTKIPVVVTLMGLGSVPSSHEQFLGMPGMHGTVAANYALMECDLLIAIGVRFDDRVTGNLENFAKNARIAHIDIDPSEIGKNVKVDIPIVGDAKNVILEIIKKVEPGNYEEWRKKTKEWKKRYKLKYKQNENGEILPQYVIECLNNFINSNSIIVTDVGQHQMWSALFFNHIKPRSFLCSGGLGTMGYGLPAAIGAGIAFPDRTVLNIQELATCVSNKLPIKIVIFNNSYLGMVRQWQELFWNRNYSKTCLRESINCPRNCKGPNKSCPSNYVPDFVELAKAYGIRGYRVKRPYELNRVFKQAFKIKGPVLIEVLIKKNENVYPMVPPGKPINELLLGNV